MANYTINEIQSALRDKKYLQEKLYVNGFLLTDDTLQLNEGYPFYGNWSETQLFQYRLYTHKDAVLTVYSTENAVFFLIGHAVDPFSKLCNERDILQKLADAYHSGAMKAYSNALLDLTGVYCTGLILQDGAYISNDCTGMQIVYYGSVGGRLYVSSHSKLVADLLGLKQSPYIERLVGSRYYHYMGTWLPGDLSPFPELRRLVPNHFIHAASDGQMKAIRFFPLTPIREDTDESYFDDTIRELSSLMHTTLALYAEKWPQKKVAISITGGRDSTTTLACANGLYDRFHFFSYISNEPERVDAVAAQKICQHLGLEHETYIIPNDAASISDLDAFAIVLECNAGCIGKNNPNDVRKRLYFIQNPKFDIEIKSWVNELGRGSQYVKYNKTKFPKKPTASYCRALYKIHVSPRMIHDTDQVFRAYLKKYYSDDLLQNNPWMELFWWEFCWSGGEGIFLTAEHRTSYEIAIPYNNRRYVAKMLTVPADQRRKDAIPIGIIKHMNPEIAKTGVVIKDIEHTDKRALLMRAYLDVFSKLRF